jgi:hypothetical protein
MGDAGRESAWERALGEWIAGVLGILKELFKSQYSIYEP